MKLTKEDYMRLPKERLAELLAELDNTPDVIPSIPAPTAPSSPSIPLPYIAPWPSPIVTYTNSHTEDKQ